MEFFIGKMITDEKGEKRRITQEESKKLNKILYKHDVIDDDDRITSEGRELIESQTLILPDNLNAYRNSVCSLLKSIYTGQEFKAEDERQTVVLKTNENFKKKEFQALWNNINSKTIYEVQFDTQQLIDDAKLRPRSKTEISIDDKSLHPNQNWLMAIELFHFHLRLLVAFAIYQ